MKKPENIKMDEYLAEIEKLRVEKRRVSNQRNWPSEVDTIIKRGRKLIDEKHPLSFDRISQFIELKGFGKFPATTIRSRWETKLKFEDNGED